MALGSIAQAASAIAETGACWTSWFHKTGGPASFGAGRWADASMGAGTPKYNAYVGTQGAATPLIGAGNDGIYLGNAGSAGQTRYLHQIGIHSTSTTLAPSTWRLCDYVMHYPLIDGDDTSQQDMDNTQTLPRYATGAGLECMAVCTTPMTANATTTIQYQSADGTTKSTSFALLASSVVGTIVSSSDTSAGSGAASPFIPRANGCLGVRKLLNVTNAGSAGGFFALVLVRPFATITLPEANTYAEITQLTQRPDLPDVPDGAYLNWIYLAGQNGAAIPVRGSLDFFWG